MNARQAIERSESHDEIVTLDYDVDAIETLQAECDSSVHGNDMTEFWANDPASETKMLWRVHVRDAQ